MIVVAYVGIQKIKHPNAADIYGAHLDITLPNASAFDVTGGEIGLFPNASQPWHNHFRIGDVPDFPPYAPASIPPYIALGK